MKKCIVIAIPIMLQTLVVSSVNLVDNLMVGSLGDVSLSAVVSANKYYNIINFTINGLIASCVIFLSQFNGAENYKKMKETYRLSFVVSYIFIFICFLIVFLFPKQLISFIIDDPLIIAEGVVYLRLASFSYLPIGISMCIAAAMRAVGDSKTPMFISALSIVVNAFLDYCLIFGKFGMPYLGVAGAAIATIIARIIEAIIYLYVVNKGEYSFKTKIKDIFMFDKGLVKTILIKAAPLLANEFLWQFGMTMLFKSYSSRGATINTAYSIATTVSEIFFILFSGMATSSTILIGHPLGANKLDEAKDNGYELLIFAVLLSIIFGGGLFISSYIVPLIYPKVSIESISFAQGFLRIMGLLYWIYMFNAQCYFILRAGGDTKSTLFMDSVYMWCVNIPLVMGLAYFTDIPVYFVYIAGQCTDFIKAFICFRMLKKEKWVKNLAIENQ